MPTAKKSVIVRRTKLGRDLERGLKTVLAHAEGRVSLPTRQVEVPDRVDVKAVRLGLLMSQSQFAKAFAFDLRLLQDWEQGRRKPAGAARAYLLVIQRNPKAVAAALAVA